MFGVEQAVLLCMLTLGAAAMLRATVGFGDALFAIPILAGILGLSTATPLGALASLLMNVGVLIAQWRNLNARAVMLPLIASFCAAPFGVWLLQTIPETWAKLGLGVVIIIYASWQLLKPNSSPKPLRWAVPLRIICGFLAGLLGTAYNTAGPPMVVLATLERWSPATFRANLTAFFSGLSVAVLTTHALSGLWTPRVIGLFVFSSPLIVLGTWLGTRIAKRIQPEQFSKIVYLVLLLIGLLFMVSALNAWW
jgi:uncharacterized protein